MAVSPSPGSLKYGGKAGLSVPTVKVPGVLVARSSGVHWLAVPSDAVAEALAATLALALAATDADAEALGDAPAPSS